jgi:hypothetical protein
MLSTIARRALSESKNSAMTDLAASARPDQRDMLTGIVDIVQQVDDRRNRQRIVVGLIRKLTGEGIDFDHDLFAAACGVPEKHS